MKIQAFLFNWRGQYEKTKEKEKQFAEQIPEVNLIVINSDDNHKEGHWINIGEESYFTAQFLKAISLFRKDSDILFHVQADASYDDWRSLVDDAIKTFQKYNCGIYAPNVDYTWYDSSRTDIDSQIIDDKNLKIVACPDCTCWFIHKDIINDFNESRIDMSNCKMGWGWDIILPSFSFLRKRPVLRDYNHTIDHPQGTNYNKSQAEVEMFKLFDSLSNDMKKLFYFIKEDRDKILQIISPTGCV